MHPVFWRKRFSACCDVSNTTAQKTRLVLHIKVSRALSACGACEGLNIYLIVLLYNERPFLTERLEQRGGEETSCYLAAFSLSFSSNGHFPLRLPEFSLHSDHFTSRPQFNEAGKGLTGYLVFILQKHYRLHHWKSRIQ